MQLAKQISVPNPGTCPFCDLPTEAKITPRGCEYTGGCVHMVAVERTRDGIDLIFVDDEEK